MVDNAGIVGRWTAEGRSSVEVDPAKRGRVEGNHNGHVLIGRDYWYDGTCLLYLVVRKGKTLKEVAHSLL